ncbi:hypothetical protein RHMOL_Rhmol01G0107300 [Rhododendron molle]|uniref:Uncharacterized protein n=1 Tax=Rhododendron molle TaxID=49168 RepID=A0ACC0PZZ7_RHOML|nr:hypothetical protein RHMOL_Rhmol01G0107300 [Rhododendron molle]
MALVNHRETVKGRAQILAIGTANPKNCFHQADYPDYYFRVTKSDHLIDLKAKFKRMCEKSMIEKRYMHVNEEILEQNPSMNHGGEKMVSSLDVRLDMEIMEIPKLGAEAATKAMDEWGQPKSRITHLVFHSTLGTVMPGVDYELIKLLGLNPSVKRFMLYHLGCYGGGTVLRLAKDLAENNPGSRVLVLCCEIMPSAFHGPPSLQHAHLDILTGHAIFGDGAGAVIVGCVDPSGGTNGFVERGVRRYEQPLFEIHSAYQTVLPDSKDAVGGRLREGGLIYYLSKRLSNVVSSNIDECCLVEALGAAINHDNSDIYEDWNSLFWIVHPAGRPILDKIDAKLGLNKEKLRASRNVLRDYGNMWSSSVLFVLDEMRKGSIAQRKTTTGEGFEWGVLLGFGPGVTVETVVLRSVPTAKLK